MGAGSSLAPLLAWQAQRKTLKTLAQLAYELGVARGTISWVIKRRGEFKQASPDERELELTKRHRRMSQIRAGARRASKRHK
jgi:hypothetical protein